MKQSLYSPVYARAKIGSGMLLGKTVREIGSLLDVTLSDEAVILQFEIDSRQIEKGALFFAIKGQKADGHDFLAIAAEKGAVAAVVERDYKGPNFGLRLLFVDSPRLALQKLAKLAYQAKKPRIIAVTGSVGKTTTKEFIAQILSCQYRVGKNIGSRNSQLTLPLTMLHFSGEEEVLVLEMGMSEEQEIARLVEIAPPEVAVITRIGLQHAQKFPEGLEGIARAKSEILSSPLTKTLIVNQQAMRFNAIQEKKVDTVLSFALKDEICLEIPYYVLSQELGQFYVSERGQVSPPLHMPFTYSHFLENLLAAIATARYFKLCWDEIQNMLPLLRSIEKRFQPLVKDGVLYINDSYNSNPDSLRAALSNLPSPPRGNKRIAVIGGMTELGDFTEISHREMGQLALRFVDTLFCFGKECVPMIEVFTQHERKAILFDDLELLKQELIKETAVGDVVLIKGSNKKQLWQLLN